ncbi:MAG TPA: calcium-binding protein [Burkholderiaceae bacterium]|nr:calcium-binding protein [Noviherbaspirillum sp.]HJV83347.1 calcium-binding protein [Noviherbaspirillum sp.]HJW55212.1 calcium-binding protein [Burkholderiaceae bacterium]
MGALGKFGFGAAAAFLTGKKVQLGLGALLHADELNGYVDSNNIDGYTFNPEDGRWYGSTPAPDYGVYDWGEPASDSLQRDLSELKKGIDWANEVERRSPTKPLTIDDFVKAIRDIPDAIHDIFSTYDPPPEYSPTDFSWVIPVNETGIPRIDPQCRNDFNNAQHPPRKDPLTFDLDGDGLETVATSAGILFDHDGDGVKQGTGWVGPDDGFLALDRNGNGTIDNGTELFGDATLLANGLKAADGFAALTQQDTNGDGKVTSADAQWENLRVWRDLNQDGVSQANELFTLNQLGIAAINVAKTLNNQTLANGNQIADLGSFTRIDGSTGAMGDVSTMGDVNLAEDTFYREFTDHIPIAEGVDLLPEMQGSGMVRDLHEAASLSPALKELLTQFSQATTRHEQRALLDQMLDAWADTSGFITSLQQRAEAKFVGYDVVVTYSQFGNLNEGNYAAEASYAGMNWFDVGRIWEQKLHVLEAFNGRYFVDLDSSGTSGGTSSGGGGGGAGGGGGGGSGAAADNSVRIDIRLSEEQVGFLNSSFAALKDSIYATLVMQTRLAPLFDLIDVVINDNAIALDFSRLEQTFATNIAADPINGISDLVDLVLCSKNMLSNTGWDGYGLMEHYIRTVPVSTELQATYKDLGVLVDGQADFSTTGTADSNIIVAGGTSDVIQGNGGNDVVFAGVGNDTVDGGLGDDVLEGGVGNDSLTGGAGNDLYLFGKGDGQDTIASDFDNAATKLNALQFKNGILPSEIVATRTGYDLILSIAGTADKVTVSQFFYRDTTDSAYNPIQKVIFSDGTTWDVAALTAKVFAGTTAADYIVGTIQNDVIHGREGNDSLFGQDGNDVLDGGDGNDNLYAGAAMTRLMVVPGMITSQAALATIYTCSEGVMVRM